MMRSTFGFAIGACLALTTATDAALAGVRVRAPFVSVRVGRRHGHHHHGYRHYGYRPGVRVRAPFVRVETPPTFGYYDYYEQPVIRYVVPPPVQYVPQPVVPLRPAPQQYDSGYQADPQQQPAAPRQHGLEGVAPAQATPQGPPLPPRPNVSQQPTPQTIAPQQFVAPRPPIVPVRPLTLSQFARAFVPTGGVHEALLLHPRTLQPVTVRFSLPYGRPKRVRVERDELEFDYGSYEVELHFDDDGSVDIEYDD